MDFRPLDPAQLSWFRRAAMSLRGPVSRLLRWAWSLSGPSRSTWFDSRRWRAVWAVNRWFSATPRLHRDVTVVRFGPKIRMELDLTRLTDVLAYCYGPGEIEVGYACSLLCPRDGVVADVGGNIGTTTLAFAASVPAGHVHTFEPSKDMRVFLHRNIELSEAHNITVHPFGLAEEPSRHRLKVAIAGNPGSAFIVDDQPLVADDGGSDAAMAEGEQAIEVRRFDEVLDPDSRLDFVKIDVEGYELHVLRGAEAVLRRQRPSVLFEVNQSALERAGTSGQEFAS